MKQKTVIIKNIYGARSGAPFSKKDAQEIGEFIERIQLKTPDNILTEIKRNKKHKIYNLIEWDDAKASHEYRLHQVKNIVNHITIEIKEIGTENVPIRAFYSIRQEQNGSFPQYVDVQTTFSNEYLRAQVISRAMSELRNWRERYRQYSELSEIIKIMEPYIN